VANLGPGDEWYLGGPEQLRGREEQSISAASGVWSTLEFARPFNRTLSVALFGEAAHVRLHSPSGRSSWFYGYGCALGLMAIERSGRLEFAWPSDAALRDGIIRLRISQSW
jgi:hemolysin activation/secretion protein